MARKQLIHLCLTLTTGLVGCSGVVTSPDALNARVSCAADSSANLNSRGKTLDEDFAYLATHIPGGFAGIYNRGGVGLVMRLKDLSVTEQARTAAGAMAGATPNVVEKADFDWLELHGCHLAVLQKINANTWTILDSDEQRNRVVVGVPNSAAIQSMESQLVSAGLPREIFIVEVHPPAGAARPISEAGFTH